VCQVSSNTYSLYTIQCYIFLDDAQSCADVLEQLVKSGDQDSVLMAYQIGFDLYDSATQKFIQKVSMASSKVMTSCLLVTQLALIC